MANANINALYTGSLRTKIPYIFPSNFTFYKWCLTKVAHCMFVVVSGGCRVSCISFWVTVTLALFLE